MSAENISILFRSLAALFVIFLGLTIYKTFRKKGTKKYALIFGTITFIIFIAIVSIIFYSANSDAYVVALKDNPEDKIVQEVASKNIPQNVIYKDVALLISVAVRLVIVSVITAMLVYLWRRSKKYPRNTGILIHQVLIAIGFVAIGIFCFYEIRNCIGSPTYREIIPLGLYTAFFAGGIFWMFICSIISAAALPEEKPGMH